MERYTIRKEPACPTSYSVTADESIPLYFGKELKQNPDRGYRGELYLTLGSGKSYPNWPTTAMEELKKELKEFEEEEIQVYQLYVYLIEFYKKPLSREALTQLTEFLEALRNHEKRVLLRFAYEYDDVRQGPKAKQVLSHISQLREWFETNTQLVNDTVYAAQLGIFGLWGEGHGMRKRSMRSPKNKKKLIKAFFKIVPETITIMTRTPNYLNLVDEEDRWRASIHDDYLIGREDPWGMLPFDHPDNHALYRMSAHSISDAEMPWGVNNVNAPFEALPLLIQAKNYGLRTLSAKHNYKEEKDGVRGSYYLEKWKNEYLTKEILEKNQLPYFPLSLSKEGKISIYDYLDYHLGYLLCAGNLELNNGRASFDIINYGMGAPLDFELQIQVGNKIVYATRELKNLTQFSSMRFEVDCEPSQPLSIRFSHIRCPKLTIRLANDVPIENGFHFIKK